MGKETYGPMWSNKTGAVSIVYGIWIIASLILAVISLFASLSSLLNYINTPNPQQALYSALLPTYWATIIVAAISVSLLFLFGYGCVRVGGAYASSSLKLAGIGWIFYSFAPLILGIMSLDEANTVIAGGTISLAFSMGVLVVDVISLALLLLASIAIIIACFQFQSRTGIAAFTAAGVLFIIGIIISYINIGSFIAFGVGLRTLASRGPQATSGPQQPAVTAPAGVTSGGQRVTMFCPHCGTRVAADERFCRSCGSRLNQD
jgi:hypothetical protein